MKNGKVKFLLSLLLATVLTLCPLCSAYADSAHAPEVSPFTDEEWNAIISSLSEEQIAEMSTDAYWEEQQAHSEMTMREFARHSLLRSERDQFLSMQPFQQEHDNYCGPASVKMIMNYYGKLRTQDSIAGEILVGGLADAERMMKYLNAYSGCTSYATRWVSKSIHCYYNIWYSILNYHPVLASVCQNELPNNTGSSRDGHIIVINGYYNEGHPSAGGGFYYIDPHYNSNYYGQFSCSAEIMNKAIFENEGKRYYISA